MESTRIPENLLFGLDKIDTPMVYNVECRNHGNKVMLAVYADTYKEFYSELTEYLEDEPQVTVSGISPMTPKEYKDMVAWK